MSDVTTLVVETVEEAESQEVNTRLVLSNGAVVRVRPLPSHILMKLYQKYPEPKPPIVEVETQGKKIRESNPSDPTYLAALESRTEVIGNLMMDLTLLRGMVVEELSADVVPYEDPAWAEELDYLGVSLPAKDCVERRLQWLRYMVVPTQEDLINIRQVADSLSQLTEGEVRAAEESFQRPS